MIMTLFRPAISLLLLSRYSGLLLPHDQVAQDVFSEVEVPLKRPDLGRLQTKVGHGVEAFGKAGDWISEAASAPLVDVFDFAAAVLDELAHTLNSAREAFVADVRADQHNKLVV